MNVAIMHLVFSVRMCHPDQLVESCECLPVAVPEA